MPACNIVFGRTGCGKTSLRNMLCGRDPEEDSFASGTTDAAILDVNFDRKTFIYVDTAGILDTRGEGDALDQSRADKVNHIGGLLKREDLEVGRVFYCVASSERILKEEIDWLADIIQMLSGQAVMSVFAVVLTKVDFGFQKKKFEKDFDNHESVKLLRAAFQNCPVVTAGYDNVDSVKRLLVPANETPSFVVAPSAIRTIVPKKDLERQLEDTQAELEALHALLSGNAASKEDIAKQIERFEEQIDDMQERITNAGWWCPGSEIKAANGRIRELRACIRDLKSSASNKDGDKEKFERKKLELIDMIKEAEADLREKSTFGKMFKRLIGSPEPP